MQQTTDPGDGIVDGHSHAGTKRIGDQHVRRFARYPAIGDSNHYIHMGRLRNTGIREVRSHLWLPHLPATNTGDKLAGATGFVLFPIAASSFILVARKAMATTLRRGSLR